MVTTTRSATVCAVFFSVAAPFVPSVAGTPAEPSRKRCRVDSLQETAKMLAALEELLASSRSFLPIVGPSSALLLLLMTPPIADLAPVSPAVSVTTATSFSARSESSYSLILCPVAHLCLGRFQCGPRRSQPGCQHFLVLFPVPSAVWFPVLSAIWFLVLLAVWVSAGSCAVCVSPGLGCKGFPVPLAVCFPVLSSTRSASSSRSRLARSSSERLLASSRHSCSSQRARDCSLLRSRPRSPARVQSSSFSVVRSPVKSCLPLDSVLVSYSSQTSYRGHSLVAPSHAGFRTHSRSPVSKGRSPSDATHYRFCPWRSVSSTGSASSASMRAVASSVSYHTPLSACRDSPGGLSGQASSCRRSLASTSCFSSSSALRIHCCLQLSSASSWRHPPVDRHGCSKSRYLSSSSRSRSVSGHSSFGMV